METEPLLRETPEVSTLAIDPVTAGLVLIGGYVVYKLASNFAKKHNL